MTAVKICGITNLDDAQLACELGAWAIGLVLEPSSPRYCDPTQAATIGTALKRRTELAGVFVNAPLEDLAVASEQFKLTMLQLHGDEGPSYCAEARRRTGVRIVKGISVKDRSSLAGLDTLGADYCLLDAYSSTMRGGTGTAFDWSLAEAIRARTPIILSGGLNSDNVTDGISAFSPFAVDVASGVEASPGKKDPSKLESFFAAVADTGSEEVSGDR